MIFKGLRVEEIGDAFWYKETVEVESLNVFNFL